MVSTLEEGYKLLEFENKVTWTISGHRKSKIIKLKLNPMD
jgi:hypothetical protein